MNQVIRILLFIIVSSPVAHGQIIKGQINNKSGDPIPYSTVYIQELKQGTTSNTKGDYEIKIPAGKYTVIYQSLGFEPLIIDVTLSDQTIIKNVVLNVQYYEIPEVRINALGEDPAYVIMRKAIGLSPYYLNNISYYKANVYLKGNLIIRKIPRLIQRSMKIEAKNESGSSVSSITMKAGDVYLMESFNEIEFTAPDKYLQKVISYNSTFPEEGNEISPMEFISASFYQPLIADIAISPLSPKAFSYYKFRYLGASMQGNFTINKIQVIPKRKSQQVFEGTVYIIEDLWCLQSVDLTNENLAGKIRVQQLYIPVQEDIWMPMSHKFEINIEIIGFKADAEYGGSVKYNEVKPNLSLQKPKIISSDNKVLSPTAVNTSDTVKTKSKKQIDKILEKDELSNRDMVKLARLMEIESEKSINDSNRTNLEIKDNNTQIIEKDAARKDSAYWTEIRPVPLSDIEIRSLRISDSIKAESSLKKLNSDTTTAGKKEKNKFFNTIKHIGLEHTWSDTSGFSFTNGGLIDIKNLSFNTVDGFIYGLDFIFSKSWEKNNSLKVYPDFRWAFSRKQIMWRINANYRFNGMKQREIFVSTGIITKDIGTGGGINTVLNTLTTLLLEQNYLKLYESGYFILGFRSEIVNGLTMDLITSYEQRRVLENSTDFSFINTSREYSDNIPDNSYLDPGSDPVHFLRDQKHAEFSAKITYTPFQKYTLNKGNKIPMGSDWPTFNLTWKHGINDFNETEEKVNHSDMIKLEVFKKHNLGAFSEIRWRVRAGGFLDNRDLTFYDFFHFNPQQIPLLINDYEDAFMIPAYYSMSTPEVFGEFHMKYTTPYLLLKLLPGLSNTLMRENITLSYLGSRYHTNYTEIGYSMSEFLFIGELGVYIGFENVKYNSIGGKIILRFN